MSAWLSPSSLAALGVMLIFLVVALRRPGRGIQLYAILGAAPVLQLGAFSGRTISQGLLMAESLATVLLAVWLARRSTRTRFLNAPFALPLMIFAILTVVSQVAVMMLPDHRMELSGPAVAGAQLLLVIWPIAVYLAAAEFITKTEQLEWLQKVMIVLAISQLAAPLAPKAWADYLGWVWTFGLFASPFALASAFGTRSVMARAFYIGIALVPFVRGVQDGKAFLYFYVAAAFGTILWLRASRLVALGGAVVAAVVLATVVVAGDNVLTDPVDSLLAKEQKQMSYGGRSGRGQLALDALSIWQEAPILGVGPGNSYIYMLQRSPIGTPHNQYLNLLVEFGLLGLAAWLVFLAVAFHTGLRIYREAKTPAHRTFTLGWLGMFAGIVFGGITGDFMIHSIRNGGLELFSGYYLQWVMLGGLVAVDRLEGGKRRTRVVVPALEPRRIGRTASLPVSAAQPVASAVRVVS